MGGGRHWQAADRGATRRYGLPERLTGRELLTYLGRLRGLDRATVAERAQELLEVLEFTRPSGPW
jgi:ABC-type Na+ transport system ATPase subunit NatA